MSLINSINRNMPLHSRKEEKETSFYISYLKASYTIEASFIMPLFITLILFGVFLFRIVQIQTGIQKSIDEASRKAAVVADINVNEKGLSNEAQLVGSIAYAELLIRQNEVPTQYILGNQLGITFFESSAEGNYIDLKVKYAIKYPIGLLGRYTYVISQESRSRKWVGYDLEESSFDGNYVYMTTHGTVYHTNYHCPYLNPSIRQVSYKNVSGERNKSGGKYYPCKDCHGDNTNTSVYVTDYGTLYHSNISCINLRRTIKKVLYEEIKDKYGICHKCEGKEE